MRFQMLKRDSRLFLRCLVPAVVLTVVFAMVCAAAALAAVRSAEDVYTPVKAAVVDGEDSVYSRILIQAVMKTDYVDDLLDVTRCDMDEAMERLESGELAAVIVLPEGAIEGITSGASTKGQIWLSPAAASHADIVADMAAFGELLLAAGQYGVFSGLELIWEHGLDGQFQTEFLTEANALLLGEAMEADSAYFDIVVTDYADTAMSTEAYYGLCWLALLLMLSALFFSRLYTEDMNRSMLCRLKGLGIGDGGFLLGKLLYPVLFQALLLILAMVFLGQRMGAAVSFVSLGSALLAILVSAAVCGLLMLLGHRGGPLAAVTALMGLLLCGGMIPRQMLPDWLILLGELTPYGAVQSLLRPLMGGAVGAHALAAGVVWLLMVPFAARARLRQVRAGGDG